MPLPDNCSARDIDAYWGADPVLTPDVIEIDRVQKALDALFEQIDAAMVNVTASVRGELQALKDSLDDLDGLAPAYDAARKGDK